jgi:hypothetical protein
VQLHNVFWCMNGFCSHVDDEYSCRGLGRLDICWRRLPCHVMLQVLSFVAPVHPVQLHAVPATSR